MNIHPKKESENQRSTVSGNRSSNPKDAKVWTLGIATPTKFDDNRKGYKIWIYCRNPKNNNHIYFELACYILINNNEITYSICEGYTDNNQNNEEYELIMKDINAEASSLSLFEILCKISSKDANNALLKYFNEFPACYAIPNKSNAYWLKNINEAIDNNNNVFAAKFDENTLFASSKYKADTIIDYFIDLFEEQINININNIDKEEMQKSIGNNLIRKEIEPIEITNEFVII
jgi:hypothetical protein